MRSRGTQRAGALAVLGLLLVAVIGLMTADPRPPDRVRELELQLRCPVCKSVSIAESGSETALAMRAEVAGQVRSGRTDQEIIDYFRARYGDWVVLDPPVAGRTAPVWIIPLVVGVVAAGVLLTWGLRRPKPRPVVSELARLQAAAEAERWRRTPLEDEP